jgi:hypothetical protein
LYYRDNIATHDLRGMSHEIALALREAQVNAANGREFRPNSGTFKIKYGVYFEKNAAQFTIFGDGAPANDAYTSGEHIIQNSLRPGYTMDLCAKATEAGACTDLPTMTILYDPLKSTAKIENSTYTYAEIKLYRPDTPSKYQLVRMWATGRIENE